MPDDHDILRRALLAPPAAAQQGFEPRLEESLVVATFCLLLLLAWTNGTPVFEPLRNSGLTLLTLIVLSPVLAIELLRRSQRAFARVLRDWLPLVGILGIYESLKHLHAQRITEWLGIVPKDAAMIAADEALFGRPLPVWLDAWGWTDPVFINLMWAFTSASTTPDRRR
jgi:hypothetical protein